ncbi:MAG: hypothetical protein LBR65_02740 [Culturomica sp.]|jgi:hypothetical protein|nr:hypothetical protein [Culturomica sp.]
MTTKRILRSSFRFIDQHPDITWDCVPESLLKCWHVVVPLDEYMKGAYEVRYEYRIFSYALRKYMERTGKYIPVEKRKALFRAFQMVLLLPYIKHHSGESYPVFGLFDFSFLLDFAEIHRSAAMR